MKKLIGSLILLSVFIACGSDGKDDSEENSTHDNPWGTFITEIDGMSYFFREYSIGNAGHIILVKDGKQVYDSTQINWNLGYIEPKIELIGTDSILIKKGVDGTGVSLRSLPTNGGIDGYVYHDIDVNEGDIPMPVFYGLTRNGVAVCFNSYGMGPDYKLLEYKKIKKLLRPNIIKLI